MRNRFWMVGVAVLFSIVFCGNVALAHFGMVIPSDTMVMQDDNRTVHVTLSFSHPMELVGMELVKPKVFGVLANGKEQDLLGQLKPATVMDHKAWQVDYAVKRPGVYMFHMEPQPYWEPAEDCFIIHLTKTVVTAFGDDEGWDAELGLKTEIVPIAKPFGLYAGNVFQGIVKMDGKPVPYAEVEVEFYNQDKTAHAPTDYMVTQTIKADADGVFTYATPAAGWWGFAALNTADYTIKHEGEDKDVEMGAVIWVYFHDWK
ncbi:ATP-dependent DNA ligase [Desulfosarcina ovata subsp. ovata]|uniref:ATP-dependent DNA ligase n=2 Tax=Desulfosarcina ovata TaxID=83564 RepID=A0A5K8ABP9_9BACT|nr:ATP-dependent DNA ligase [Desulfosarcina ovata subsp. ovata]